MGLGHNDAARKALKVCEQILKHSEDRNLSSEDFMKIKALTMNNLGCYYKK